MATSITGGCQCGAIRYECTAEPMFSWICHCRECQRSTGGGGAVNVVFAKPAVRFTQGEPKYHTSIGTSGEKTHRGFCPDCGSPLAAKADLIPDIQGISAASLDDPAAVELIADIWTASLQPWDHLDPKRAKIEGTPDEQGLQKLLSS